jgi:arylsulfatase A-like enzyme
MSGLTAVAAVRARLLACRCAGRRGVVTRFLVWWVLPGLVVAAFLGVLVVDLVAWTPLETQETRALDLRWDFVPRDILASLRAPDRPAWATQGGWPGLSLGEGWARPGREGVWGLGSRSTAELYWFDDTAATIWLECRAHEALGGEVGVEVRVNGASVATLALDSQPQRLRVEVPRGVLHRGGNHLELRYMLGRSTAGAGRARQRAVSIRRIAVLHTEAARFEEIRWMDPVQKLADGKGVLVRRPGALIMPFRTKTLACQLRFNYRFAEVAPESAAVRVVRLAADGESLETVADADLEPGQKDLRTVVLSLGESSGDFALVFDLESLTDEGVAVLRDVELVSQAARPRPSTRAAPTGRNGDRPDVVVIILDAARPDHFGCYGYHRDTTPTIDRIASAGLAFSHAYALAPYTYCSVSTMITGVHFASTGVVRKDQALSSREHTLAEYLRGVGYHTVGISATPNHSARYGHDQGYDEPVDVWRGVHQDQAIDPHRLARIARERILAAPADEPLLMVLHFVPPHAPYTPKRTFDLWADPGYRSQRDGSARGQVVLSQADQRQLVARYDGNLRMADDAVSGVISTLKERGRWDRTLLIVTSDHGEAFFEHGVQGHNATVYEEMLQVPLIIRPPRSDLPVAALTTRVASLEDLVPTILGFVGVAPGERVTGLDLFDPAARRDRGLVLRSAEADGLIAVRWADWKLVCGRLGVRREMYDLKADPHERTDRAAREPVRMALYRNILLEELAALPEALTGELGGATTGEDRAMLRALGYAE